MDNFLELADAAKTDEYIVCESTLASDIWKEQLRNTSSGKTYNFKNDQKRICNLVNCLNNGVKKYELLISWLKENGFINNSILDTFYGALIYENPTVRVIDKEIKDKDKAFSIYKALKKNNLIEEF